MGTSIQANIKANEYLKTVGEISAYLGEYGGMGKYLKTAAAATNGDVHPSLALLLVI